MKFPVRGVEIQELMWRPEITDIAGVLIPSPVYSQEQAPLCLSHFVSFFFFFFYGFHSPSSRPDITAMVDRA